MVNKHVSRVIYSLDGQRNVTVAGNTTLTDLTGGKHNLTVCVMDLAGNTGTSETVYFNVDIPEPFPTIFVAVSVAIVVTGSGLFAAYYLRKRKNNKHSKLP